VVELNSAEEIFPAYTHALARTDGKSTLIIEHGNFYNEEYYAKRKDATLIEGKTMKVTLLIPTLNEIGGMKAIMPLIKQEWYDQLLIVDGNSTDGTIEYCRNRAMRSISKNKGHAFCLCRSLGQDQGGHCHHLQS